MVETHLQQLAVVLVDLVGQLEEWEELLVAPRHKIGVAMEALMAVEEAEEYARMDTELLELFVLFGPVILVNFRQLAWGRHELVY